MNTTIVKVEGVDVLSIGVDRVQQTISQGPNQGEPYWRCRYNGRGFIITNPQFLTDFDAGEVATVNLVESEYEVEDPMDPNGAKLKRPSYNFVSYATYTQVTRIAEQQGKLALGKKKLDVELQVLEKEALAKFELSDKKLADMQEAL